MIGMLRGAALAAVAALGIHAPALAQRQVESASASDARSQATNRMLLEALLKRRAEVAQSANGAQDNRAALDFLDRRIAEIRSRIGS
jgi:hypothetical protein